jgi:hypothetical protein
MKRNIKILMMLLVAALTGASLVWVVQAREGKPEAVVSDKCVCGDPIPELDNATEGQLLSSKLYYCKCGNLECVVAFGSFGGMGGKGKNYGISCVK